MGEKRGGDRKRERTKGGKRMKEKEEREGEEMDESPCTIVGQFKININSMFLRVWIV